MMLCIRCLFVLFVMSFVACVSVKQSNDSDENVGNFFLSKDGVRTIKVCLDDSDYYNHLSDYLCVDSYIKLSSDPLLAPLKKVLIQDERIYVLDRQNQFVCYKMNGDVLFYINAVGSGPGEYAEITDFAVNSDKGELVVYDNPRMVMLYYTLDKGLYIRRESFPKPVPSEMMFYDGLFFYNNQHSWGYSDDELLCHSLLASLDCKTMEKYSFPHVKSESEYHFSPSLQTFYVNNEALYYCKNFDTDVYELSHDSIIHRYRFNLPNPLPSSVVEVKMDEFKLLKSGYSFGISNVYENGNLLYFRFFKDGFWRNVFYDLEADKQVCCVKALQENYHSRIPLINVVSGVYKEKFFSVLAPDFIDYSVKKDFSSFPLEFQEYDAEMENPIIMFYKVIK